MESQSNRESKQEKAEEAAQKKNSRKGKFSSLYDVVYHSFPLAIPTRLSRANLVKWNLNRFFLLWNVDLKRDSKLFRPQRLYIPFPSFPSKNGWKLKFKLF